MWDGVSDSARPDTPVREGKTSCSVRAGFGDGPRYRSVEVEVVRGVSVYVFTTGIHRRRRVPGDLRTGVGPRGKPGGGS